MKIIYDEERAPCISVLEDSHGREFDYLRLSLTEACNFSCKYCLPNGYSPRISRGQGISDSFLNPTEISNLISSFADLGIIKVRLTGGEPTLRRDLIDIVQRVAVIPKIVNVAITTNGYRLDSLLDQLCDAGLSAVNISLDSLDPSRFKAITGMDNFDRVFHGLEKALSKKSLKVKINAVLLKENAEEEIELFTKYVKHTPVSVRFIELMETGLNRTFFKNSYFASERLVTVLKQRGWLQHARGKSDGPAIEFSHPDHLGRIGVIAPYSKDFCNGCNRLRVSATGNLKLCLFGDGEYSLREYLQFPDQSLTLKGKIVELLGVKAPAHRLQESIFGTTDNLACIGG